jgi:hypothetical protein
MSSNGSNREPLVDASKKTHEEPGEADVSAGVNVQAAQEFARDTNECMSAGDEDNSVYAGEDKRKLSRRALVALGTVGVLVVVIASVVMVLAFCAGPQEQTEEANLFDSVPVQERSAAPKSGGARETGSTRDIKKPIDDKSVADKSAETQGETDTSSGVGESDTSRSTGASGGSSGSADSGGSGGSGGAGNSANGNSGLGTGGSGSTGSAGNAGRVWHEGWSEWVVDVPGHYEQRLIQSAWDEQTGHYGSRCNDCGADISGFAGHHLLDTGHSGYSSSWFTDGTIHHDAVYEDVWVDEQGHRVWHDGYWE